ncbi:MAG: ArsR family transcriptional regulator [Betaproteobacteria bacterium]|nr:MAG: ArsR family transcriptional regulator [Betaproteobacteria bacterium]
MPNDAKFAEVASLVGDATRAAMLHALMDGRALTASELARVAGITPQTASAHLARMVAARLIGVAQQGRHRYHRLASPAVAQMIESIMQVAFDGAEAHRPPITGPRDAAMRLARTCYDHLAGRLGVAIADALVKDGHIVLTNDGGLVTENGAQLLARIGIDVASLNTDRGGRGRMLCRPCLDWSERRPHLAGALGAALCALSLQQDWIRRRHGTRAVIITAKGHRAFWESIGVSFDG